MNTHCLLLGSNSRTFRIFFCLALFFNQSCNELIDIELDGGSSMLVVDAWLNNMPVEQVVKLTLTQPYFDSTLAIPVEDARVFLKNPNKNSMYLKHRGGGRYTWFSKTGYVLAEVGDELTLTIELGVDTYEATTVVQPVPAVDSITYSLRRNQVIGADGIYAQFYARDLPDLGNAYWIKTYKNSQYLNKPSELNIAFDAGVDFGANLNGVSFIPVIRELVNRVPDKNDYLGDNDVSPYAKGDSIRVEIHSISLEAFRFLKVARSQINKDNNAIFSTAHGNPRGNIMNTLTGKYAIGMFNVAAVEAKEKKIK